MSEKTIKNYRGQLINIEKYDYADFEGFVNGFAIMWKDDKSLFINEDGREICKLKYEMLFPFRITYTSTGPRVLNATMYRYEGRYGLISKEGVELTSNKYDRIDAFDNDQRAYAESGKLSFWLDENGKETPIISLMDYHN